MVLSVVNLQEAYAKALLVDRDALARRRRRRATCSAATRSLLDAYRTDVRPLCAKVRADARRGRGPGRRAPRVRLRGADVGRAR